MKQLPLYSLLIIALIINGCHKGDHPAPGNGDPSTELPKEGVSINTSVFGRIVDEKDAPVQGVTVTGGGATATTDMNGVYMLTNVMMDQARAYITAKKTGFFQGSRIFRPVKDGMSKPSLIKLMVQKSIGTINAASGGTVQSPGGVSVELPANAIEGYTGQVNVVAAYLNPTAPDFLAKMPGDLQADNAAGKRGALISQGMSHIDLLDNNGNKLTIRTGSQVTISLPIPESIRSGATPRIALWYFDETKGLWKEEGSGALQDGKYVGKVSHFSTWNFDHWNINMVLPIWLRWVLPKLTSLDIDAQDQITKTPPDFLLTLKDKPTGTVLFSTILPPLSPNTSGDKGGSIQTSIPVPQVTTEMQVTIQPVQPGGPDYPTAAHYSPTGDETPPAGPTFTTEQESVTVDFRPTTPPTQITITFPPPGAGGGGNGETIVNVNGKAVNCGNKPVTSGYAYLSMRSGNTIVKSLTAPVFGTEGRFTCQYLFMNQLPNRIDNVVLTVYDVVTGKRSADLKYNVNPSVPYMIPQPVSVCENNGGGPVVGSGKVLNGNYSIYDAASLKVFVDSGYTEVTGTLTINNIDNAGGITKLKKVGGLEINRSALKDLGGLAELEQISGGLTIVVNPQLVNAAFPKLANKTMSGNIYITSNRSLVGVTLPSVETMAVNGSFIQISDNPVLSNLSIPNLKSVDGCNHINIDNTLLKNLDVFANASGTLGGWGMDLTDNDELLSVAGLGKITISGRLTVSGNAKLPNLNGMVIQATMTDWVNITYNDLLTDISALSSKLVSTASFGASHNAVLTQVDLPLLTTVTGFGVEDDAKVVKVSAPKLASAQDVYLTTLPVLASFNMNLLATMTGRLYIDLGYDKNQPLAAFDLPALTKCAMFELHNMPALTNLDGFASLETIIPGNLAITNGNFAGADIKLKSVNGFNKLKTVGGSLTFEGAAGSDFKAPLAAIKGFSNLTTCGADLAIAGLNLTDISGFKNVTSVRALKITNTGLTGVDGLSKLVTIKDPSIDQQYGAFDMNNNPNLVSMSGMSSLTNVNSIYFYANPALKDLNGFEKIQKLGMGLNLSNNVSLASIEGLSNLGGSSNDVSLSDNIKLKNFCPLSKIVKGGGAIPSFRIHGNGYNPTRDDIQAGSCSQ